MKHVGANALGIFLLSLLILGATLTLAIDSYAQERKILVRGDRDYPPYEFLDEKGQPTGFNVELIQAVAEVMGLKMEISLGPWEEVRGQLEDGRIDALSGMYYSESRGRLVNFSVPHIIVTHTLLVRKGSPIKSLDDIGGKEILVQHGDIMHDFLVESGRPVRTIPVKSQIEALKLLDSGKYDAALAPKLQALYFINKFNLNNIEPVGPSILPRRYCFAVKKGDDVLLAKLNEGLDILGINGKYGEIHDKWFGVYDSTSFSRKVWRYLMWILIPLLGLLALISMWSWILRKNVADKTNDLTRELAERRKIEEELLVTNTILKTQQEASIDGILVVDYKGRVVSFNRRFTDIWGIPADQVLWQSSETTLAKALEKVTDPDLFLERVRRLYRQPDEKSWDEIIFKDGSTLERYSTPIYGSNDQYMGRVWYFRDITERKRSEKALLESERRYRTLFESANDAILLIAGDHFVDCNERALEMFRCRRDQIVNTPPADLSPPFQPDGQSSDQKANDMISAGYGGQLPFFEWKHRRLDGELFDVEVSLSLLDIHGESHLLTILRDITARKEAERERKSLTRQLQQAQKMEAIGTLAGGIAHDFNNILSAIIGYTELALLDMEPDTKSHGNLLQTLKASKRARDLVKQILTFSREEHQEAKPLKLKPIVSEALEMIRAIIPPTVEIREDLRSEAKVAVDPTKTHQVLINLCANAAHAMREKGGLLEVKLTDARMDAAQARRHPDLKEGAYVKLTVKDNGKGIPPHLMERIFDPFFTTKDRGEGTGMGLSVAHGVVKSCGGAILVDSKPGEGAVFDVYLPVAEMKIAEALPINPPTPQGAERILFIGDNEEKAGKLHGDLLKLMGYRVTVKTSPEDALELFKRQPDNFQLVITDLVTPYADGLDVVRELTGTRPDIPVILCAGFGANLDERKILSLGVRAVLRRPIVKRELAMTIKTLLDERQRQTESDGSPPIEPVIGS